MVPCLRQFPHKCVVTAHYTCFRLYICIARKCWLRCKVLIYSPKKKIFPECGGLFKLINASNNHYDPLLKLRRHHIGVEVRWYKTSSLLLLLVGLKPIQNIMCRSTRIIRPMTICPTPGSEPVTLRLRSACANDYATESDVWRRTCV